MVDSRTPLAPSTPANQTASTLWTVFLGTALLGLVAVPKQRGHPPVPPPLWKASEKLGAEGAARCWRRTSAVDHGNGSFAVQHIE